MAESYRTVTQPADGLYEERRSRFLARLFPVQSEQEARACIEQVRRQWPDARHHVHAYSLRQEGISRFSDDGEPHGTAGRPVFDVLAGAGLTDVCLTVTRYFGGVLLGTGGLCRAYGAAAKDCLAHASITRFALCRRFVVCCAYPQYSLVAALIESCDGSIQETLYEATVQVRFALPREQTERFLSQLTEQSAGCLTAQPDGETFAPVPCV